VKAPAVILVPGVGPHDRDYVVLGHRRFLVLADHLTRRGFAVLRCDDRGVGGSTGLYSRGAPPDFALDVDGGVAYLQSRPEIDPREVGVVGHSDGGTIAMLAAARDPSIAFVVSLSSPGLPGRAYNLQQEASVWQAMGLDAGAIAEKRRMQEKILDIAGGGLDSAGARAALLPVLAGRTCRSRRPGTARPWKGPSMSSPLRPGVPPGFSSCRA
jgi:pimeloyl-ACP methyl ester carboxylesterase